MVLYELSSTRKYKLEFNLKSIQKRHIVRPPNSSGLRLTTVRGAVSKPSLYTYEGIIRHCVKRLTSIPLDSHRTYSVSPNFTKDPVPPRPPSYRSVPSSDAHSTY